MRNLVCFSKKGLGKRILSLVLVFAMALTLIQVLTNSSVAKAADNQTYITIHYDNSEYKWSTPALQYWGGDATVSNCGDTVNLETWGVNVTKLSPVSEDANGWYTITIKGDFTGFQLVDYDTPANNTGDIYVSAISYCNKESATDIYLKRNAENEYKAEWFTDAAYTTSIDTLAPADSNVITGSYTVSLDGADATIMTQYSTSIYETALDLEEGTHSVSIGLNGSEVASKSVKADADKTVYVRVDLSNGEASYYDSVNNADKFHTAAIAGDFSSLSNCSITDTWAPAAASCEMDYLGGGIFAKTITFDETTEVKNVEYKVAFDDAWSYSIGQGSGNVAISIPAGSTSVTVYCNEPMQKIYDSVKDVPFNTSTLNLAGTVNGWSSTATTMVQINNHVLISEQLVSAGKTEYKYVKDGAWEEGSNHSFTVDGKKAVLFAYDAETAQIYDSINNTEEIAKLLAGDTLVTNEEEDSFTNQTLIVHYQNTGYEQVAAYMKTGSDWSGVLADYAYTGNAWPGALVEADAENDGWYSFTVTYPKTIVNLIINNNNNGSQLATLTVDASNETNEFWLSGTSESDTVKSTSAPEGWVTCESNAPIDPNADSTVVSPVVNNDGTVTFNLDATGTYKDAETVYLRGNLPCTDWNTGVELKNSGDVFTYTTPVLSAGVYDYKFVVDGAWMTDPMNKQLSADGNSKVVVSGLASASLDLQKGKSIELPASLKLYDKDGNASDVTPTYSLKGEYKGVTLDGTSLSATKSCEKDTITVIAKSGDATSEITVNVKEKVYTYTIYYYDSIASHMAVDESGNATAADCYAWEDGGAGLDPASFTSETLSDGKVWLKATIQSSATKLGVIPRSMGEWSWQNTDHFVTVVDGDQTNDSATIYIVSGDSNNYTELPEVKEARDRYVMVEYNRPDNDYDGWNIYSWNSGLASETEIYTEVINGKHFIIVPVKDSDADFKLGFCMRRTTEENPWEEKDGGDHYITVPADQTVVYAVFDQGQGVTSTLAYNQGYEMKGASNAISFYYRDDSLLLKNEEATLAGKVKVNVNGTDYDMTYDETNQRYEYTLENCKTGTYNYYYVVDGTKTLDAFNTNTAENSDGEEVSTFDYKHFDASISATLSQDTMNYGDNNVLTVSFGGTDGDKIATSEIRSMEADLSNLGLDTMSIDPSLMKVSIAVSASATNGTKTIPVTVTDIYGNIYTTSATVEVTGRDKTDTSTFDWDEAVIYMTCTDRFFDGNTSNNTCEEYPDDYDPDGSLSYHGGDFAGLEEKLDYLESLGVNTIWITPIVENSNVTDEDGNSTSTGYHGYWASDFTKLNSHLGTEEEFASLISAVHERGMKLMVDVVLNHAGYDTEDYFNNVISGKAMLRDSSNTISGDDKYDSLSGLPDFVTEDSQVRDQLIQWQTDWVEKYGIDYFRVDTVKHVDDTTWEAFKNALTEIDPDFKMIGEYSGAGYTSDERGIGAMDSLLDFDFNDQAEKFSTGSISDVESFLTSRNASLSNASTLGAFLSSHDEDGLVQKLQKNDSMTEEEALNAFKVAAALQLTAKGQAVIYYGEEIGLYGEDNYPIQSNRYDFDWEKEAEMEKDSNSMLNHYKKLLAIRKEYKELLARGTRTTLDANNEAGYDVFSRTYNGESLYIALNIKNDAQTVKVQTTEAAGTKLVDLYSDTTYVVDSDQTVSVSVPASSNGGTVILAKEKTLVEKAEQKLDEETQGIRTAIAAKAEEVKAATSAATGDATNALPFVIALVLGLGVVVVVTKKVKHK